MPFPANELRATRGEIYGHLFENPKTGLPLDVYWALGIEFAKVHWAG